MINIYTDQLYQYFLLWNWLLKVFNHKMQLFMYKIVSTATVKILDEI